MDSDVDNKETYYSMIKEHVNPRFISLALFYVIIFGGLIGIYILFFTRNKKGNTKIFNLGTDIKVTDSGNGHQHTEHFDYYLFKGINSDTNKVYKVDFSNYIPPSGEPIHIFYDIGSEYAGTTDNDKLEIFFGTDKLRVGSGFASKLIFNTTGLSVSISYIDGKWRAINLGAEVGGI